jgi:hypothetical protein
MLLGARCLFFVVTVSLGALHHSSIPCLENVHIAGNPRREGKGWRLPGSQQSGRLTLQLLEADAHMSSLNAAVFPEPRVSKVS